MEPETINFDLIIIQNMSMDTYIDTVIQMHMIVVPMIEIDHKISQSLEFEVEI